MLQYVLRVNIKNLKISSARLLMKVEIRIISDCCSIGPGKGPTSLKGYQKVLCAYYIVKPRIREPPYFGIRLAKVLKLRQFNRTFLYAQTVGRERDNVIKLSSEITFGSSTGPYVFHKTIFIQNGL